MALKSLRNLCALTLIFGTFTQVDANVVGGMVTGGSSGGVFEFLPTAPAAAGPDETQSPNLIAFNEKQDLIIPAPLSLGPNPTIPAGTTVSSHYVIFDPEQASSLIGYVDFDEPILALIAGSQPLQDTESAFGLNTTTYTYAPAVGFELNNTDSAMIASGNPNRLMIQAGAASPGDHLRVLTGTLPVPEPGSLALIGIASLALLQLNRKR